MHIVGFRGDSEFSRLVAVVSKVKCCESVHKEFNVADFSELSSASFDCGAERFGRCICEPSFEVVYNGSIVIFICFKHFVELIVSKRLDLVVPPISADDIVFCDIQPEKAEDLTHRNPKTERDHIIQAYICAGTWRGAAKLLNVSEKVLFQLRKKRHISPYGEIEA